MALHGEARGRATELADEGKAAPFTARGARLLAVILTATLFSVMNSTMVNVAIPSFMRDFHIGLAQSVWLYTGYVLPYAISQPLFGVLGEHLGAKRVFLYGTGAFLVTSLLCSAAWGFPSLVGFRVLQALASAAVVSNALVIVTGGFPANQRGTVLGVWSAVAGVGVSIGLALSGWLVEYESWRAIFWVNAPFLLAVVLIGRSVIPDMGQEGRGRQFDIVGAVLLAIGVGALILGLTEGQTEGWSSALPVGLFVLTPLGIGAFLWWEGRAPDALMPRALVVRPAYALSSATMFLQSVVFFGMFLLLPLYLQELRGRTPLETGVMTIPLSAALIVVGPMAGRLSGKIGPRLPTSAGLMLIALGAVLFSRLTVGSDYLTLAVALVITGVGIGASMSPLTATAMSAATPEERGAASGFFNMVRFVGAVIGTTVLSTVVSTRMSAAAQGGASHLQALQEGFHDAYLVAAVVALVGLVVALFMRKATARGE
jgi:EmrB/QacA subfamily drug resistance transporter